MDRVGFLILTSLPQSEFFIAIDSLTCQLLFRASLSTTAEYVSRDGSSGLLDTNFTTTE